MKKKIREKPAVRVWADFQKDELVTDEQLELFQRYEALLSEWNKTMNLTAITGASEVVHRHFSDSLALRKFVDLAGVNTIADIGSGAGFPAIPLKILFPHLGIILIEVSNKKQRFLRALITALELENVEVCTLDWRTFLRTTQGEVDYFIARASLDPVELSRLFKPGCSYKNSKLIYWAIADWQPEEAIKKFVREEFLYTLKRKKRKLVVMGLGGLNPPVEGAQ